MNDAMKQTDHDVVQELLPWFANSTLDASEAAQVEAHLAACSQCREEYEFLVATRQAMAAEEVSVPTPAIGLRTVMERIEADERNGRTDRVPVFSTATDVVRRCATRWFGMMAGPQWVVAGVAIVLMTALVINQYGAGVTAKISAPYSVLSSDDHAAGLKVQVVLNESVSASEAQRAIGETLQQYQYTIESDLQYGGLIITLSEQLSDGRSSVESAVAVLKELRQHPFVSNVELVP